PVHAERRGHIVRDLADRVALIGGQLERQVLLEAGRELALELEPNSGARALGQVARPRLHELLVKQLVEGQTAPTELGVLHLRGSVHQLKRLGQLNEAVGRAKRTGMRTVDGWQKLVQMLLDQRANLAVREAFGGGIMRQT